VEKQILIKTIQGTDIFVSVNSIESVAVTSTGCAVYLSSGTVWHTMETVDLLLPRIERARQ